jgi:hypothetical protein
MELRKWVLQPVQEALWSFLTGSNSRENPKYRAVQPLRLIRIWAFADWSFAYGCMWPDGGTSAQTSYPACKPARVVQLTSTGTRRRHFCLIPAALQCAADPLHATGAFAGGGLNIPPISTTNP